MVKIKDKAVSNPRAGGTPAAGRGSGNNRGNADQLAAQRGSDEDRGDSISWLSRDESENSAPEAHNGKGVGKRGAKGAGKNTAGEGGEKRKEAGGGAVEFFALGGLEHVGQNMYVYKYK
ncbi:MAG: hypothetical protein LBB08_02465, partial [Rickettsiales bacterium]|nr:hypothetical protein [Rickettsiales bacterium]